MIYRLDKKKGNFLQVHRKLIDEATLSTNAKMILIYMLSKNDTWQFYELDISKHFTDSLKIIRKGIKELIAKGYINRLKFKNEEGKFTYIYTVYEHCDLNVQVFKSEEEIK